MKKILFLIHLIFILISCDEAANLLNQADYKITATWKYYKLADYISLNLKEEKDSISGDARIHIFTTFESDYYYSIKGTRKSNEKEFQLTLTSLSGNEYHVFNGTFISNEEFEGTFSPELSFFKNTDKFRFTK